MFTQKIVFEPSKIAELRHKAASESVPVPTRVEAVMSLIWSYARKASRSNLVIPRQAVMSQAMDLRLRIPSNVLPQDAIGNLQIGFSLKKDAESEFEIPEIVAAFRKTKEGVNEMIKESVQSNTTGQSLLSLMAETVSESPDIDRYIMSSWCRKPFYEVDFGSGSPVWVGFASHTNYDNMVDGVEAWISLPEEDMSLFVDDQELLAYAVLNPPVLT